MPFMRTFIIFFGPSRINLKRTHVIHWSSLLSALVTVSTFYPYTVQEAKTPKNLQITINHTIYIDKNLLDPCVRRGRSAEQCETVNTQISFVKGDESPGGAGS